MVEPAEVPAVPDVDRHRPRHQQRPGRHRGADGPAVGVRPNAEIRRRAGRRRVERQALQAVDGVAADHRGRASVCISRAPSSTRSPTRFTGRCRSSSCSRSASSTPASCLWSSSTRATTSPSRPKSPSSGEAVAPQRHREAEAGHHVQILPRLRAMSIVAVIGCADILRGRRTVPARHRTVPSCRRTNRSDVSKCLVLSSKRLPPCRSCAAADMIDRSGVAAGVRLTPRRS